MKLKVLGIYHKGVHGKQSGPINLSIKDIEEILTKFNLVIKTVGGKRIMWTEDKE